MTAGDLYQIIGELFVQNTALTKQLQERIAVEAKEKAEKENAEPIQKRPKPRVVA